MKPVLVVALAALLTLLIAFAGRAHPPGQDEKDFTPLVRGADVQQFRLVEINTDTISISEGGEVALTGRPNGYFATKESYRDYILRFEWKYDRPAELADDASFDGNSGVLLHIREPHKVWPACVEAQLMNRDAGHIFGIAGGKFTSRRSDLERQAAQKKAIKPVGQWNKMEVQCEAGAIRVWVNDVLIDEGDSAEPADGPIGFQSEGRPIRFRNLRIQKP